MTYQKNQSIELTITDLGSEGEGIGKTDAFTWFIKDAVPGDRIRASVMKVKKSYGFARLQEIITPSPDRIKPVCPVAGKCGGCVLQDMRYEAQLSFKENKVRNNIMRIGGFQDAQVLPVIGMENPFRYRNKAEIPAGLDRAGHTAAGFYAGHSHFIVPCEDCLLEFPENRDILKTVTDWMKEFRISPYDEEKHTGLIRHILIRKGFSTGEIMVCLIAFSGKVPHTEELCRCLTGISGIKTVALNINRKPGNVILGDETRTLAGSGFITDTIGSVSFRISAQSFYQVNSAQTEKLYRKVLEYAGLTGKETVWDLYCGIGTISLFLAKEAAKVYGVEIVPQAVEDARKNAERNGIRNAEFFTGKAEEVLPEQLKSHGAHADVIVTDPPRKGCDEKCLQTMLEMKPKKIVYVSCDSATLARDLKILCASGEYTLEKAQPVDMFPQTAHVETVVLMSRVEGK